MARHPFLVPPYHGSTSIVSIFDHDSPNYLNDGLTIAANGAEATPDPAHHRTDFPAFWNSTLRQYLDYDGHNGYDYDLYYQSVYAAAAGKVIFAALEYPDAPQHGYGNMVMIDHHNGYVTLYGHFSKLLVKVGQKVRQGQKIGISGNTGHSTGPHLHFTVFHNCSPTDPYGWSGSGEDPLDSYQGETSIFLWERAPQIINPLPGWPGLSALPAVPGARRLLLRLPSTRRGTKAFEVSLHRRAARVRAALRPYGGRVRIDLLRGSVDITQAITPQALYALPFVASIEAPDSVDGTRAEVLTDLARAELTSAKHRAPLAHSRTWTGYLVQLAGRTVLVGRGTRGREVALRLPSLSDRDRTEHLRADPRNGVYAVDLGKLSNRAYRAVARALRGAVITSKPTETATPAHANAPTEVRVEAKHAGTPIPGVVLSGMILLLLVGAGLAVHLRRAKPESGP